MVAPDLRKYNSLQPVTMRLQRKWPPFERSAGFNLDGLNRGILMEMPARYSMPNRGFTLIELLIVIAIILIIAAIAIPNLLHSRIAANEASAVSSIRSINSAEVSYQAAYPTHGYAAKLADLGGGSPCTPSPTSACLVDRFLTRGVKSGYNFAATGTDRAINGILMNYTTGAAPVAYNQSGIRWFCSTSDAIIRYSPNVSRRTTPPSSTECHSASPLE